MARRRQENRISRRRAERQRRAARLRTAAAAAATVAALALVVGLVYASVTSAPWRLGGYTVQGTAYLTAPEVLEAAGFETGDNLFWIDPGRIERNLCRHPRIKRAEVRRRLPAEIVITVEERSAAAALILNGELYKISADGVLLEPMTAGYEDLPLLAGVTYRARGDVLGKRVDRGEVREGLTALTALTQMDPAWGAAVEYVDLAEQEVVLAAGRYGIRYGPAFDEHTARRLRRVYEATRDRGPGAVTYDARFGTDVIVTGGSAGGGGDAGGDATDEREV
ncbi:MAG: FtsQ-type POTRA domain-containing protein [Candidatus Coatesbacteria bacterium]|nr:MAG: FtsQ-type POTRA domain-containing protein [Candidatus Coatesbacteria bacterium]